MSYRRTPKDVGSRLRLCGALALCSIVTFAPAAGAGRTARESTATSKASKLIIFTLPFACGLNTYASQLCDGVKAAGKALPGFDVQIKTGTNYADTVAYNNLLQTSYQLNPAGVIAFVDGPAAQTPTLKQACAKGIKVILIDSPATGMGKCQSSFVGSDHYGMGVADGKWLIKHPPAKGSKEVAIVTQPPGEYASTDARVRGFKKTVEAAGYKVVATTIITDLGSDKNVTLVTNMVTAHPNLGAIFSANGPMGDGTAAALKNNKAIVQLTLDGDAGAIQALKTGDQNGANTVQDPFAEGRIAVTNMAKVIQRQKVAALTYTPSMTVDKTNVAKYIASGGMR